MDEKMEITEVAAEQPVVENAARVELETLLNELLPEEKRTGNVEEMALEWIKEKRAADDRIIEALSDDPRAAQMFADIANGERKAGPAIVKYFGKAFMDAEEGTPEYDELMKAEEEFHSEREGYKKAQEENDAKMTEFFAWLEGELAEENGAEGEMLKRVYEEILVPLLEGRQDEKLPSILKKGLSYDKDVEDALVAGEVKGRNMNINEMRGRIGDGMPKGLNSQSVPTDAPKRKMNPLIAKALGA